MSRKQVGVLVTLLLGVLMGALDIFIVAPALGAIQVGLQTSARLVTWSFTAYTLVLVVTQPFVAKLSDRYGRRWVYVGCVVLFGAGSLLCAVATGFAPFILGRTIQAIGAGGILPVASAVIGDVFPKERRGTMLGIVASVWGLAFLVGPPIGAVLTSGVIHVGRTASSWHTIFLVNLPLVVVVAVLAVRVLPTRAVLRRANLPFDWNGVLLLGTALFFLIFGLTQINFTNIGANFVDEAAAPFLLLALFLLLAFWLNELRAADPIVDVRLFGRRQLIITMCLSVAAGIITSSVVYVPQLVESALHLKAGLGGYYLVAIAVPLFAATPRVGKMIDRYGSRRILNVGGIVSALGFILIIIAGHEALGLIAAMVLIGLGLSTLVGTPLRYIVTNESPADRRAASLSVLTVCNSIGQTIVLPLGGAFIATATVNATTQINDVTTLQATHAFYLLVLGIVLVAAGLTFLLKSRHAEQTSLHMHHEAPHPLKAARVSAPLAATTATHQNEAQPAMSSP